MLDEYKEDFGSGIDDLQFDPPESSYGFQQDTEFPPIQSQPQQPVRPAYAPPQPRPVPQRPPQPPVQQYYEPEMIQPGPRHIPQPSSSMQPVYQPQPDPVHYEQPVYPGAGDKPSIGDVLRSREPQLGCLRVIVLGIISLAVIGITFWGSFLLGQKIFAPPVKDEFNKTIATTVPDFLNPNTRKTIPLLTPPEDVTPKEPQKIYVRSTGLKVKKPAPSMYTAPVKTTKPAVSKAVYRVIAGSFTNKQNADLALQQLKEDGFQAFLSAKGAVYQIQIGAFGSRASAQHLLERALSFGYEAFITN